MFNLELKITLCTGKRDYKGLKSLLLYFACWTIKTRMKLEFLMSMSLGRSELPGGSPKGQTSGFMC